MSQSHHPSSHALSDPHSLFSNHLNPFGTTLNPIDQEFFLRICMQNPQHLFKIYGDCIDLNNILANLNHLDFQMFAIISPNIIWVYRKNWFHTKCLFWQISPQVHLSATSSDIGLPNEYANQSLIGGAALLTMELWASKVSHSFSDPSGMGSFTVTTINGKHNRYISFISAYIAISKGSNIDIKSVYAQQTTLYEKNVSQHRHHPRHIALGKVQSNN
jgi:hypothetical protein